MVTLAIDMMGGDLGSPATLEGVKLFLKHHEDDVKLILVGKKEELEGTPCEIVDARDVLPMNAGVLDVLRAKDSSMVKAINLVKEGKAGGVVSCGGTGGFLSASTITLKKIPGIERPALVTAFPTKVKNKKVVILDVGASNENNAQEIAHFGLMGSLYAKYVFGAKNPSVFLLSNGTEEGKGSPEGKEAAKLMEQDKKINFKGNIEAREVVSGDADVVVSDGFTGNVLLKGTEGAAKLVGGMIKSAFKRNLWSKIGYLFAKKGFDELSETLNYKNIGGALLVGINGVVVKAHGVSDGEAFAMAIELAYSLAKNNIVEQIKKGVANE